MNIFEYLDAHTAGYNEGVRRTLALIQQIAAKEAAAAPPPNPPRRGRSPSGLANGADRRPARRRRGLSTNEEFALLAVTENPGLSFVELKSKCGLRSPTPLYDLVRRRMVRRVEDPKPHRGPWVRFYPMEPTDAQA